MNRATKNANGFSKKTKVFDVTKYWRKGKWGVLGNKVFEFLMRHITKAEVPMKKTIYDIGQH